MATTETLSDYEKERGKPMPSFNHSTIQALLIGELLRHRAEYHVASELSLELEELRITPDISVYPKMKVDWTEDEVRMTEPPLVAVEITSPSQPQQDLVDKARQMLQAGVQSCWLVQPMIQAITVFSGAMESKTYAEGPLVDPATDIEIDVKELFDSV